MPSRASRALRKERTATQTKQNAMGMLHTIHVIPECVEGEELPYKYKSGRGSNPFAPPRDTDIYFLTSGFRHIAFFFA